MCRSNRTFKIATKYRHFALLDIQERCIALISFKEMSSESKWAKVKSTNLA